MSAKLSSTKIELIDEINKKDAFVDGTGQDAAAITTSPYSCAKWVGSNPAIKSLYSGLIVWFKIGVAGNGTYGTSLNINNLGEHPVIANVSTMISTRYAVGCIIPLIYDADASGSLYLNDASATTVSGVWKIADYDSNTTITYGTLAYYLRPYTTATLYRYKFCVMSVDNKLVPLNTLNILGAYGASTTYAMDDIVAYSGSIYQSLSNDNKGNKPSSSPSKWIQIQGIAPTTTSFRPDKIYWYTGTTTVSANGAIGANTLMSNGYNATNMAVCNFNGTVSAYKYIYLRGTYNTTTGLFQLAGAGVSGSTSYFTLVPNNTNNIDLSQYFVSGEDYILLGASYSSANYIHLREDNLLFHFDGINLLPYDTYRANTAFIDIVPNNSEETTQQLLKLEIGDTNYSIHKDGNANILSIDTSYNRVILEPAITQVKGEIVNTADPKTCISADDGVVLDLTAASGGVVNNTAVFKASLKNYTNNEADSSKTASNNSNRLYPVELDKSDYLAVTVPWVDTTYTAATTSANGLMSSADKVKLDNLTDAVVRRDVFVDSKVVATFDITASSKTVYLRNLVTTDTVTIDWGDGTITTCSTPGVISEHTYSAIGTYVCFIYNTTSFSYVHNVGAFSDCSQLVDIQIPDTVTEIGDYAFNLCENLRRVTVGYGNPTIGSWAFRECTSLEKIELNSCGATIGTSAFYQCSGITNIILPDNVVTIGDSSFAGCTNLKTISIGNNVTTISDNAFLGCTNLTEVYYRGFKSEWDNITIGTYNTSLNNAIKYYLCDGVSGGVNSDITRNEVFVNDKIVATFDIISNETIGSYTTGYDDGGEWQTYDGYVTYHRNGKPVYFSQTVSVSNVVMTSSFQEVYFWQSEGFPVFYKHLEARLYNGYLQVQPVQHIGYEDTDSAPLTISIGAAEITLYNFQSSTIDWGDGSITNVAYAVSSVTHTYATTGLYVCFIYGRTYIGTSAFSACPNLQDIKLPNIITSIGDNAFLNCLWLKTVYYYGAKEEWDRINISATGNTCLENATKYYFYDGTGGGSGTPELTTQYVRIYDLDYGIYKWNYNGQKYLYPYGQSGTSFQQIGIANTNNFIIYVYAGYNMVLGGACKSYIILASYGAASSASPYLYYGDCPTSSGSIAGTFISGSLNPVTANVTSATTETLTSLKVGNINYAVGGGSSSAGIYVASYINPAYTSLVSTGNISFATGQALKVGDLVIGKKGTTALNTIAGSLVVSKVTSVVSTFYNCTIEYDSTVASTFYRHNVNLWNSSIDIFITYIDKSSVAFTNLTNPDYTNNVGPLLDAVINKGYGNIRVNALNTYLYYNTGILYDDSTQEINLSFYDGMNGSNSTMTEYLTSLSVDDTITEINGAFLDEIYPV